MQKNKLRQQFARATSCRRPERLRGNDRAFGRLRRPEAAHAAFPGVLACAVVAAAATFLSEHYGAPVMLFALLLGMAMNFLSGERPCAAGIEFTARQVLRIGVALLGLRITFGPDRRARLAAGGDRRRLGAC